MPVAAKNGEQASLIPRATYRLQFHEGFPLSQALELVPYLKELGVSHIYASPLSKARPHSSHGYDVCDFNQLNPELGTEAGLAELVRTLRANGMGLVLDIVPNHMGIGGPENRWWWDVLANGPESPYAKCFDIDWNSPNPRLRGKVLAPILGDRYHKVLANHELQVERRRGDCLLRYGANVFPLNAVSLKMVKATPEQLNANPDALDALLEHQYYRLEWYGRGDGEVNYRRFCNITDLPAVCIENEQVFNRVLDQTRQWVLRGWLDGLRVDHVDGLRDPEQFLKRLRHLAPEAWIVVEKILMSGESLRPSWPIHGTTGYDFINISGGLFLDPSGGKLLAKLYSGFTGKENCYQAVAREKKRQVLRTLLAAEVDHLTDLALCIGESGWRYSDFTREEVMSALIELAARMPLYRCYAQPRAGFISPADTMHFLETIDETRRGRPDLPSELLDLLEKVLLLNQQGNMETEFVERFQQLCAAAMAKGAEDTAFYCFNQFIALNEVGGDPGRFGVSVDEFHEYCRNQQDHWPSGMLASSTHDTKRSEDVRARLALLSEVPHLWRSAVGRWSAINERHRHNEWPDRNTEYFYYQTLVGAWPLTLERALACMEKSSREAKEYTNFVKPNAEYDSALRDFITATLADQEFTSDLEEFVAPLLKPAAVNSLAQTLLKLTAPGVPDIYQGTELWDFSLVDPDNRRPVDFPKRVGLLAEAGKLTGEEAWQQWQSGLPKLWLIRRVLNLRARRCELLAPSVPYEGLAATGRGRNHVIAFKRGKNLVAVIPRLLIQLHNEWADTALELPPGKWRDELTDRTLPSGPAPISDLLNQFPVALLTREGKP